MKAILAFALLATACTIVHASEPIQRPALELKGIKIGDGLTTVQAALPDAKCETLTDPSLSECWQGKGGTIGGKPAQLLVRLLDGKVVYVIAVKMIQEDAYAVIDALKVKYGAPDKEGQTRVTLVRPTRDTSVVYKVPFWIADNGNQELTIQPANFTDQKKQFTYAAVSLVDIKGHNATWMPKFRGEADASDL